MAVAQTDAADEYLSGYMLLQDAESLEKSGSAEEAFKKYQRASDIFDAVYSKYPNWEPRMVEYRRKKIRDDLGRVYNLLPANSSLRSPAGGRPQENLPSRPRNPMEFQPRGDASSQLAQKDRVISEITAERDNLLRQMNEQAIERDRAEQLLKASEAAKAAITQQLRVAEERIRLKGEEAESSAEVSRLKKDLSIANDTIEANDKRFKAIKEAHDKALSEITRLKNDRDSITKEYAALKALLDKNESGDMKKLVEENAALRGQLSEAQKEIVRLKGENEAKDQEITSLKEKIKSVETQLAKIKEENEDYRDRIMGLTAKLKQTQKELADTVNKSREGINAEMQKENKILQEIIVRQLKQQARRHQAKQLVLNELSRLEVESDSLLANVDRLSGASFALTDEEREIFKAPMFRDAVDEAGGMSASIFTEAGESRIPEYPDLTTNDGEKNQHGLNSDMTQFAKAAAYDFIQGNFETAEVAYERILEIVPDNIYTLRNLGIVKTRLNKLDEADRLFMKAITYDRENDYSHFLHGSFNYRQEKLDRAMEAMKKVVELNPKNAKAHYYMGAICLKQKKNDEARKHFLDVVAVQPGFADAHYNLAYLLLDKDRAEARNHYRLYLVNGGKEDKAMNQKLGS